MPNGYAVHRDLLPQGIGAKPKFRDDLAIDLDASHADQFFALPTTADSSGGKDFLQTFSRLIRRDVEGFANASAG
ncbi:hypothetical protein JCM17478_15120 [Thermopirellula anaerolimosa]